jgi:hypothetical protein
LAGGGDLRGAVRKVRKLRLLKSFQHGRLKAVGDKC